MNKLLLASLLSLSLVTGVHAHDHTPSKPDGSRMAKHLEVTENQLPAFQAVMQEQFEKRRALYAEFREKNQALEAETHAELATVLTPEQLEKLAAMKENRHEKWQDRARKHGDHKRFKRGTSAPDTDITE
jgi:Spy/CpxP family protein refolding chaperone